MLEGLFEFYFVQKQKIEAKRAALNQKLLEAGKPPMKEVGGQPPPAPQPGA